MTPAETLVHRNLPADAQAALAALPGPGYLLRPDGSVVAMVACPGLPAGFGWCPADTADILGVSVALASEYAGIFQRSEACWVAHCGADKATGEEPIEAALRLLAAVWPS